MSNSDKNIIISPSTGSTDVKPSIQFTGAGNSTISLTVQDNNIIDYSSDGNSLLSVQHDGSGEDILVITNQNAVESAKVFDDGTFAMGLLSGGSGNIGVGTTQPSVKLDVVGDILVGGGATILGELSASGSVSASSFNSSGSDNNIKLATASHNQRSFYQDNLVNSSINTAIKINGDGTKALLLDGSNRDIHTLSLSVPYNLNKLTKDSSFDIRESVTDPDYSSCGFIGAGFITDDGTRVYQLTSQTNSERFVSQFNLSTAFDASTAGFGTHLPLGRIGPDGSFDTSSLCGFNTTGTRMYMFLQHANSTTAEGIIEQYNLSTPWDVSTAVGISSTKLTSLNDRAADQIVLKYDGTKAYVMGRQSNDIIEFDLSTPYEMKSAKYNGVSKDLGGDYRSFKFKPDGTKLFAENHAGTVFSWALSAWDISTLASSTSLDVSAKDNDLRGIDFGDDGGELYVVGQQNRQVHRYSLSTDYDLSTASFVSSLDVGVLVNNGIQDPLLIDDIRGPNLGITTQKAIASASVGISTDGTKLFVGESSMGYIAQWNLSTPYDITTGVNTTTTLAVPLRDNDSSFTFDSSGLNLYASNGEKNGRVQQYHLSSAWDLSTAETTIAYFQVQSTYTSVQYDPDSLLWNSDGKEFILHTPDNSGTLDFYKVVEPYDIRTASRHGSDSTIKFGMESYQNSKGAGALSFANSGKNILLPTLYGYKSVGLTSAYESKTMELDGDTWSAQSQNYPSFDISPDGRTLIVNMSAQYAVAEVELKNPWDFSNWEITFRSYEATDSTSLIWKKLRSQSIYVLKFSPDGRSLYAISAENRQQLTEYTLEVPYRLRSIKNDYEKSIKLDQIPNLPNPLNDSVPFDFRGLDYNNDGTKFYLQDNVSNYIYEVDLLTPWDITSMVCNGNKVYSTDTNNYGGIAFTRDGMKMYQASGDINIYQWDLKSPWELSTATLSSESIDTRTIDGSSYVRGIKLKPGGDKLFATSQRTNMLFSYNLKAEDISFASSANVGGELRVGGNITVGGEFKISSLIDAKRISVGVSSLTDGERINNSLGIVASNKISAPSVGPSRDISALTLKGRGGQAPGGSISLKEFYPGHDSTYRNAYFINDAGTKLFAVDSVDMTADEAIYSYNLRTAHDLSTLELEYIIPTDHLISSYTELSLRFKPDGTKLYITRCTTASRTVQSSNIEQWDLSTAWDIRTAVRSEVWYMGNQHYVSYDFIFKSDGTKLYALGGQANQDSLEINEYTLSSAWELSGVTHTAAMPNINRFDVYNGFEHSIAFKPDGKTIYLMGYYTSSTTDFTTRNPIQSIKLSTAWDLSTAIFGAEQNERHALGSGFVQNKILPPRYGMFLTGDGMYLYTNDDTGTISQYLLTSAYDFSTIEEASGAIQIAPNSINSAHWANDGKSIIFGTTTTLQKYNMAVPYDLRTIDTQNERSGQGYYNHTRIPYFLSAYNTSPLHKQFSSDGTKLYSLYTNLGNDTASIVQYCFNEPWNISGGLEIEYTWTFGQFAYFLEANLYFDCFNFSTDGKKLYLHEYQNPRFYEFELQIPWELSSAVEHTFTAEPQHFDLFGAAFNSDGTVYYGMDTFDQIYKVYLPNPYDINNRQYIKNEKLNTTSTDNNMRTIVVGSGSSEFYTLGHQNDSIYQWSLDADDFSDSTLINTFSVTNEVPLPYGLDIKSDGTELYVVGDGNTGFKFAQYTLSTPWNLATAGLTTHFDLKTKYPDTGGPNRFDTGFGIQVVDSGKTVYVNNYSPHETIERFTLTTPYDLSTITFATDKSDSLRAEYSRQYMYGFLWTPDGSALYTWANTSYQPLIKYNASVPFDIDSLTIDRGTGVKISGHIQHSGGEGFGSNYRWLNSFEFDNDGLTIFASCYQGNTNNDLGEGSHAPAMIQYNLGKPYDITTIGFTTAFYLDYSLSPTYFATLFSQDRESLYVLGANNGTSTKGWYEYDLSGLKNSPLRFPTKTEFGATAQFDKGIDVSGLTKLSSVGIGTTIGSSKEVSLDVYGGADIDVIRNDFDLKNVVLPYSKVLEENAFNYTGARRQFKQYEVPAGGQYQIPIIVDVGISTDGKNFYMMTGGGTNEVDCNVYQFELATPYKINTAIWPAKNSINVGDDENLPSTFGDTVASYHHPNSDFVGVRRALSFAWKPDGTKLFVAGDYESTFRGTGTRGSDGRNAGRKLITYSLDTAWDLSTLNVGLTTFRYLEDFRLNDTTGNYVKYPYGINFNDDGSKLYFTDENRRFSFDLSSNYVVGTANTSTYARSGGSILYQSKMIWKSGGSKSFVLGYNGITALSVVRNYEVDDNIDENSSQNYLTTNMFPVSGDNYSSYINKSFEFSYDGKYLYYLDQYSGYVYGTELRTAWDPSTLVTDFRSDPNIYSALGFDTRFITGNTKYVPADNINMGGLNNENWCVSDDGRKVFVVYSNNSVICIKLNTPWDFSDIEGGGSSGGYYMWPQSAPRYYLGPKSNPTKVTGAGNDNIDISSIKFSSDGLNFYVHDHYSNVIHHYECEIPWDLGSLVKKSRFTIGAYIGNSDMEHFAIKEDGTRIYLILDQHSIHQFDLTVPYNLDSAVKHDWSYRPRTTGYLSEEVVDNTETSLQSFTYNNDGTKMYSVDSFRDAVYEWKLSTPYKISTSVRTNTTPLDISAKSGDAVCMRFKPDGTELFILDDGDNKLYQYTLPTGYDLTTASFTREWSVTDAGNAKSITFNGDGTKLYVAKSTQIYQFTLGSAYNISSVTYDSKTFQTSSILNSGNGYQTNIGDWEISCLFIQWNSDGTCLYYAGTTYSFSMVKINVRVPYDLSTAFFPEAVDVGNNVGRDTITSFLNGQYYINDVTTFVDAFVNTDEDTINVQYSGGSAGVKIHDEIIEIKLRTSGDLQTANQLKNVLAFRSTVLGDQVPEYQNPYFSNDGCKLYLDTENSYLVQFLLRTPWDITTAEYSGLFNYNSYVPTRQNVSSPVFKPDMSCMWFKYRNQMIKKVELPEIKPLYITKELKISGDVEQKGNFDVKGTATIRDAQVEYLTTGNDTRNTSISEVSLNVKNTLNVNRISNEIDVSYGPDVSLKNIHCSDQGSLSAHDRKQNVKVGTSVDPSINLSSFVPVIDTKGGVGFSYNGKYLYETKYDANNNYIIKYELEVPYKLDNVSYKNRQVFSFSTLEGAPETGNYKRVNSQGDIVTAFFIDNEGENIYVASDGSVGIGTSGFVNQYTLSTPNDLSTIGWTTSFDASGTISRINDIFVGAGGTALYLSSYYTSAVLGDPANLVYQFNLSTENDVSTASIGSTYGSAIAVSPQLYFRSIGFSTGGDKFYQMNNNLHIETIPLTTPWVISTANTTGITTFISRYVARGGAQADTFTWSHDGKSITFYCKATQSVIETLDVQTPWTLVDEKLKYGTGSSDIPELQTVKGNSGYVNLRSKLGSLSFVSGNATSSSPWRVRFSRDGKRGIILYSTSGSYQDMYTITLDKPFDLQTITFAKYVNVVNTGANVSGVIIQDMDITPDGKRVFLLINNGNVDNKITYFDLDIPWDVSSYRSAVGISTSNYYWFPDQTSSTRKNDPRGLQFSPDGMSFTIGYALPKYGIHEYKMDRPYEINTAKPCCENLFIYNQSEDDGEGMFMSRDGSKFYTIASTGDVHRYDIPKATPYNLNEAVYNGNTVDISGDDGSMFGIYFKDDGTKMYTCGKGNDNVYEYTLSTAWDVTTKGSATTFDVSSESTAPSDIEFSRDGSIMIISSDSSNRHELVSYKLSTPWSISTASKFVKSPIQGIGELLDEFESFTLSPDGYTLLLVDTAHNPPIMQTVTLEIPYQIDSIKSFGSMRLIDGYSSYNQGHIHEVKSAKFSENGDKLYLLDNYNNQYGGSVWTMTLPEPFSIDNPYFDGILRTTNSAFSHTFSPDGLTLIFDGNQTGYLRKYRLRKPYQLHDATTGSDYNPVVTYITTGGGSLGKMTATSEADSFIMPIYYSDSVGLQKFTYNDVKPLDIVKPVDIKAKLNVEGPLTAGGLTIDSDVIHISPGIGSTTPLGAMYTDSSGVVKSGINPLTKLIYTAPPSSVAAGLAYTTFAVPRKYNNLTTRSIDGEYQGGGVLAPNGKIYFYKYENDYALEIDPGTGVTRNIVIGRANYKTNLVVGSYKKALSPAGEVYGAPYSGPARYINVHNPFTNKSRVVGLGTVLNSVSAYGSITLTKEGTLVCMPYNETRILEIDPGTDTCVLHGNLSTSASHFSACLGPDGNVYGIPYTDNNVTEFNPVTKAITQHASGLTGGSKFHGGVLAPNGCIYCIPYSQTTVGKFDPVTKNFSTFGTTSGNYVGGTLAPNGRIYAAPFDADKILEIDPVTDTVRTFATDTTAGIRYYGSILGLDNKIYATPYDSMNEGLVITPPNVGIDTSGFVRGDDWIYSAYVNNH